VSGWPALDGFATWLRSAGYKRRPGQLLLRGAAHLGHWTSARGVETGRIHPGVLDAFAQNLPPVRTGKRIAAIGSPGEVLGIQDDDVAEVGLWLLPTLQYTYGDPRRAFNITKDIETSRQETLLSSPTSAGAWGTLRRDRLCLWSKGLPVAETE
jgi:hypothetical protein